MILQKRLFLLSQSDLNLVKTDWEVEFGVVISKRATYVDEKGDVVELGADHLGVQRQEVVNWKS